MSEVDFKIINNRAFVEFKGDFINFDNTLDLYKALEVNAIDKLVIIGQDIKKWDSSLLLILFKLTKIAKDKNINIEINNMPSGLIKMSDLALFVPKHINKETLSAKETLLEKIGTIGLNIWQSFILGFNFIIESMQALILFMRGKSSARRTDFLFSLEECGPKAISITALISFMVGLILAFVGAIQLKTFGAEVYVASLVTIGMIRIMGAIMVGIIIAGRTGASFAATIGTMQVNEETDALKTMGIELSEFLIAPRMFALIISMPFLTMWADFFGILGGAFVGITSLDIPAVEYWRYTFEAWSMKNFWVGIFHGFIYGFIISLCGCYYGINCSRNADGVGVATTKAVVSSIVWIIVATGIITYIFERLGI